MAGVVKVTLNGVSLIDIRDSTITPPRVLSSYVGYESDGDRITGTAVTATATVSGTTLTLTDGFPVEVV